MKARRFARATVRWTLATTLLAAAGTAVGLVAAPLDPRRIHAASARLDAGSDPRSTPMPVTGRPESASTRPHAASPAVVGIPRETAGEPTANVGARVERIRTGGTDELCQLAMSRRDPLVLRVAAARALEDRPEPVAFAVLVRVLAAEDEHEALRAAAAETLTVFPRAAPLEAEEVLRRSRSPLLLGAVADYLGRRGDSQSASVLAALEARVPPEVASRFAAAIARITCSRR